MRIRITTKLVQQLKPGQSIWDSEVRGFGVRRQVSDRVFVLKCIVDGRQKFITIGKCLSPWTVDTARAKARELLVIAKTGQLRTNKATLTVSELCDRYVREHCPRKKPRSAHSDERLIENHIRPLLGTAIVAKVIRSEIETFHTAVRKGASAAPDPETQRKINRGGKVVTGGTGVANRAVTLLSKMFNLAEDWGLRPQNTNPARRIKKFPEQRRNRFLNSDELRRLGHVLAQAAPSERYAVAAVRLSSTKVRPVSQWLLLTSCRSLSTRLSQQCETAIWMMRWLSPASRDRCRSAKRRNLEMARRLQPRHFYEPNLSPVKIQPALAMVWVLRKVPFITTDALVDFEFETH